MPNLTVKVYPNPANANFNPNTVLADWTADVQNLQFSSSAFGGFQTCTFTLKRGFDVLWRILEGKTGLPTFVTNRLRVDDPTSTVVPWEGLIATIELQYGQQTKSRTYQGMYNAVRVEHYLPTGKKTTYTVRTSANLQSKFGIRVYSTGTKLRAAKNASQPVAIANRFLQEHQRPTRAAGTEYGGVQGEVFARVICLGMADTLRWRYGYNTAGTTAQDTSEILRALLASSATNKWTEPEVGAWGQQFIETDYRNIDTSGILVAPKDVQGKTRLDIISELCRYGSSDSRRMLFQVFQGRGNVGKGMAWFKPQYNDLPFTGNYKCYYYSSIKNVFSNRSNETIPPWRLRGGNWIVDVDSQLTPPRTADDIFDDPRAIWAEELQYDVDNDTLKIMTTDQSSAEVYLSRVIQGASLGTS